MQELYTRIKAFFPCEALEERRGNLAFLTVPADSLALEPHVPDETLRERLRSLGSLE